MVNVTYASLGGGDVWLVTQVTTIEYHDQTSSNILNTAHGLPDEMVFTDANMVSVITYSVLLVIAAIGNLTVFTTLFRNRRRQSRFHMFVMHLASADLIVTFIMMPMEIGWHATVNWKAGDFGCRVLMFFRPLGFYLSSFILVAISLDRYLAIAYPLCLGDGQCRSKLLLLMAWLFSIMSSIPQVSVYSQ